MSDLKEIRKILGKIIYSNLDCTEMYWYQKICEAAGNLDVEIKKQEKLK